MSSKLAAEQEGVRSLRFISIDPGSIRTGFAILEPENRGLRLLSSGTILMEQHDPLHARLFSLAKDFQTLLDRFHPQELALETMFFAKNARSAIFLSHARGVILMKAAECGIPIFEYSPTEVKKGVTGAGRASKEQIEKMIRLHLKLSPSLKMTSSDQSDAIAIGLYHYQAAAWSRKVKTKKNDRIDFWQDRL